MFCEEMKQEIIHHEKELRGIEKEKFELTVVWGDIRRELKSHRFDKDLKAKKEARLKAIQRKLGWLRERSIRFKNAVKSARQNLVEHLKDPGPGEHLQNLYFEIPEAEEKKGELVKCITCTDPPARPVREMMMCQLCEEWFCFSHWHSHECPVEKSWKGGRGAWICDQCGMVVPVNKYHKHIGKHPKRR